MTKDELIKFLYTQIGALQLELEDWGDLDELVENVASNGNHDDTFRTGQDIGWIFGRQKAYENVLNIILETPDIEHSTN